MTTATLQRHPTEVLIDQARELLKPTPVRLHHVPRWLVRRIRERLGKPDVRYPGADDYLSLAVSGVPYHFAPWVDHWGSIRWHGQEAFVSEPYLSVAGITAAVRFAERLELHLDIQPNSWWFPGRTTRLLFELPEAERTALAEATQEHFAGKVT